jgi:ABC-type branched-subunit amino acid transport system permease subunit
MRVAFKTSYEQDLGLFPDGVHREPVHRPLRRVARASSSGAAYLVDISLVFIDGLCGLSLMVLAGYIGLDRPGHAALLDIGAYAHVSFVHGLPRGSQAATRPFRRPTA